jgi:hypothetical protein
MPGIEYFGADEMGESESKEFLWYAERKDEVFDNSRELERHCQDDVTVLREASDIQTRLNGYAISMFFSRQSPLLPHAIRCYVSNF